MEQGFDSYPQYIQAHTNAVKSAFYYLREAGVFSGISEKELEKAERKILKHDHSKFSDEEWDAYDAYFYGRSRSFEVVEEFKRAWLHHIHENRHHWQHWVLIPEDPGEELTALEIPDCYIVEMVCDWASFGYMHGDVSEVTDWYDSHKKRIVMHPTSRRKIEDILDRLR